MFYEDKIAENSNDKKTKKDRHGLDGQQMEQYLVNEMSFVDTSRLPIFS